MARKNRKLGHYIKDRKEKYRKQKVPRFLVHVSLSPRKILYPKITPYAWDTVDQERANPLLFLSPVQEIAGWLGWCYYKKCKRTNKFGYTILYIHIIQTPVKKVWTPKDRFNEEYVTEYIQKPVKIVPIRYYPESDAANLQPLFTQLKLLKKYV